MTGQSDGAAAAATPPSGNLARQAGLTAVGLVLIGVARVLLRVGAEHWFGVAGLGIVTLALSVSAIVTIVGPAGASAGITKLISELRGRGRPEESSRFVMVVARLALISSLAGGVVAALYALVDPTLREESTVVLGSMALVTLIFGLYQAGKAIAYGEQRIGRYVALEVVGFVAFVVAMWWVVVSNVPNGVVVPLIAAYLPVASLAFLRVGRGHIRRVDLPMRTLGGYAAVGIVGAFTGIGFTQVTPIAATYVDAILGAALVGAILTVLEPLFLAARAINLVLLPDLSFRSATGRRGESAALLAAATRAVAVMIIPVCAVLVLERNRALQLVFSDEIVGGLNLAWFSGAFYVSVVGAPLIASLAAIRVKDAAVATWSGLLGLGTAIIVWVVAAPRYGLVAIGFGYFVGSVIEMVIPGIVATTRYAVRWGWFWARVAAAWAVVVAAAFWAPALWIDGLVLAIIAAILAPELGEGVAMTRRLLRPAG